MKIIVPDASVLLKWVLPSEDEEDQQRALKIRDLATSGELKLKVPSLWLYEVSNTLSRRFPKYAAEIIGNLMSFGLEEARWSKHWLEQSLLLTSKYKVTFYDAAYHGLALTQQAIFVTADGQYVAKTHAAGAVVMLSDWK